MKWLGKTMRITVVLLSRTVRVPVALLALVLIMGGGALLAEYLGNQDFQAGQRHQQAEYVAGQHREQAEQRAAGILIERKLCTSFAELASDKPPAGNPLTNPSRAFDQKQHAILVGLGTDLGCH